ncbi:MAG: hypothetical protein HC904_09490 [Blastochloris sp.]|nr:hypothetical protein [Blastochloris sp.]
MNELNALNVQQAVTVDGDVEIRTGGNLVLETLTAGAGGNALLVSGGNITQTTGKLGASFLEATANGGIRLITAVDSANISASGAQSGSIEIFEDDDITLLDIDTVQGAIEVLAGGLIEAVDVATTGAWTALTSR